MDRREGRDDLGWRVGLMGLVAALASGCEVPSAHTVSRNYGLRGEVPVDPPRVVSGAEDDCVAGGRLYKMYCGSCHNARPLGERPLSNYHVAITHMRDQAYLTGKEYRQIILFLRRWQAVGPATPPVEPSPKRFIFSQPISELRGEPPPAAPAPAGEPLPPLPPPGPSGGAGPLAPRGSALPPRAQPPASSLPAPIP